jgi:hypothetical protein
MQSHPGAESLQPLLARVGRWRPQFELHRQFLNVSGNLMISGVRAVGNEGNGSGNVRRDLKFPARGGLPHSATQTSVLH